MATLPQHLAERLHASTRELELRYRNWSGPDAWVFPIYADGGESYQGSVELIVATEMLRLYKPDRWLAQRERAVLEKLIKVWNRRKP